MSSQPRSPLDTPPVVDRAQINLLRQAGHVKRAALAAAMTTSAVAISRRALKRVHPDWSEQEIGLKWAELHYGKDLADRVRAYMARRPQL
jgi:hypothetical protein